MVLVIETIESVIFILMKDNKSRKVLKKDGPREIAETEKAVALDFLWWSGSIPLTLIVDENQKDLTVRSFSIYMHQNNQ